MAANLLASELEEAPSMPDQHGTNGPPATTLVWIDSELAILARWRDGTTTMARIESEVPARRKSTGQVSHASGIRSGGGGGTSDTGEPHRLEHLARFLKAVAEQIADSDRLVVIGPGIVHERLAQQVVEHDREHRHDREVQTDRVGYVTDAQLRARLHEAAGIPPPRRKRGVVTGKAMR